MAGRIQNEDLKSAAELISGGGSAAQLPNDTKVYVTANGINDTLYNAVVNGLIGAGGAKNYVANPQFSSNATTNWSLFNTTLTSGIPTGSISAGAASITTFTTTGTTPLQGLYSLQIASTGAISAGQGFISDAFNLDRELLAKIVNLKFQYEVISGAANLNMSGTSSNTFAIYLYDTVNSAWIQPAGVYSMVQKSLPGIGYGTFQTPSTSLQYRLAIVCVNASAGAATINFDDFFVGQNPIVNGSATTDDVAYTPTIAGQGTPTNVSFTWKRIGDSLLVQGSFTVGTTSAVVASISLPTGLVLDSTKIGLANNTSASGPEVGDYTTSSVTQYGPIVTATGTSTTLVYLGNNPGGTAGTRLIPQIQPVSSSVVMSVRFKVPISGWSSNVDLSSDTDTRVVAAKYNTSTQTVGTSAAAIVMTTKEFDTHGAYNTSNGIFTVPVSGKYRLTAHTASATAISSSAVSNGTYLLARKNNVDSSYISQFRYQVTSVNVTIAMFGSTELDCNAGDTLEITIQRDPNVTSHTLNTGSAGNNWILFERISGPAVIAASDSVSALYKGQPTGTLNSSFNTATFPTKVKDTHGAYSSGIYTVPISGTYSISAQLYITGTYALNTYIGAGIHVDGTEAISGYAISGGAESSNVVPISVHGYPLVAGQQITIKSVTNATSPTFNGNAAVSFFSIARTGNY